MTNACGIQDPQRPIAFRTPLLGVERVVGRATQGSIWLRSKRGAGKAVGKGGTRPLGWTIGNRRAGIFR